MNNNDFPKLNISKDAVKAATNSKAWPFEEARKIVKRYEKTEFPNEVIFETGYGPSGLPHIGTFGEVARTSMVIHAFRVLTGDKVKVRLICFSDDMDGMRRVPDNVPNKEMMEKHIGKPLTDVPDPFSDDYKSFAEHNNARLCDFLDKFNFTYEFASATEYYKHGKFDEMLIKACEKYDEIMKVMLPTLGEERQATYSAFLPISPTTGRVLYVPIDKVDAKEGTITFDDEDGSTQTISVKGGNVKMQWKPDFGMRWAALNVDFEMYGKDHMNNSKLYDQICRVLLDKGGKAPEHFIYELFLDENGEKISKSKGNGLSVEEWLTYAPTHSLALFMYARPKTAKKLFFEVIPRNVDEYYQHLNAYHTQDIEKQLNNPVWHIHNGQPPKVKMPVSFSMLLNLVSAANANDKSVLWGFISKYAKDVNPISHPELDELTQYAIKYYEDFVKPNKKFRDANEQEKKALIELAQQLENADENADGETLQTIVYSVGTEHGFEPLKNWFQALYQVLLGQDQGPRFGSFVALYGINETVKLIKEKI